MRVAVVYNPNATGFDNNVLNRACRVFSKYGSVRIYTSTKPGETVDLVKKANDECDYIVTLGGDGTMGEAYLALGSVVQKALYSHISVGTANDTADNLGLYKGKKIESIDLFESEDNLVEKDVDMLKAGSVPFAYVSCCGTFTNFTYETPKSLKQKFGKLGYYLFSGLMGVTTIPDILSRPLKLEYLKNGQKIKTNALTLIVSNSKTFGGFNLFRNAKITDGIFEVTVLKKAPTLDLIPFINSLFQNDGADLDLSDYSDYIDSFSTDSFDVSFLNGMPKEGFNHDGDQSDVALNENNSLKYKVGKKVKMILPKRALK